MNGIGNKQKQQSQQQHQAAKTTSDLSASASMLMVNGGSRLKYQSFHNNPLEALVKQPQLPVYHSNPIDRRAIEARPVASANGLSLTSSASQATPVGDLATAAGHHHGHAHGKYYEYREVPKKKTWKFGYKRGNHKHTISRHEHGKAGKKHSQFKTKVKWHDKKSKGKGIHLWDYNHHDKKHGYHG